MHAKYNICELDMVVHPIIPAFLRRRQKDHLKFRTSQGYPVSKPKENPQTRPFTGVT